MGSVQSEITCKKCKFPYAMEEYYYKSGEVWVFCPRCGYNFSAFMKHDPGYGKKMKAECEKLIAEGKVDEALKLSGNMGWVRSGPEEKDIPIAEWTTEEKIKTIKQTWWETYHKKDKDGNIVWDVKSTGGFGAYMHRGKRGFGRGGSFTTKVSAKKVIRRMIKDMKHKRNGESIHYTKKLNGKWFMIDARTDERAEIPNDIGFLIWMRRNNGDLKPYDICPDCKGNGGIKLEGSDEKSWKNCESCKGEGILDTK